MAEKGVDWLQLYDVDMTGGCIFINLDLYMYIEIHLMMRL